VDKFKILIVLLLVVIAFNVYFVSQLMALLKTQNPTIPSGTPLNITNVTSITPKISYKDSIKTININITENLNIKKDSKYVFYYTISNSRIINSTLLLVFYNTEDEEVSAVLQLSKQNPYGTVELDKGKYKLIIYVNVVTNYNLTIDEILSSLKITFEESK